MNTINNDDTPLSTILNKVRLSDSFFCKSHCYAPWGFVNPPGTGAIFHFVVKGSCIIEAMNDEIISINEGDLVLLPRGDNHALKSDINAPIYPFDSLVFEQISETSSKLTIGRDGKESILVCGGVSFNPSWHPVFEMLPDILCLKRNQQNGVPWLDSIINLMESEVSQGLPGNEAVITRLCEVLVVGAIRNWLLHNTDDSVGWIQALKDYNLGRALTKIHQTPSKVWTVALLAAEAALSRTVFSERFTKLVGIPPIQYLSHLRMNLAGDMLRKGSEYSIGEISEEIGYSSEISFSRAFKKFWGKPPGSFRRHPEVARPFGIGTI